MDVLAAVVLSLSQKITVLSFNIRAADFGLA